MLKQWFTNDDLSSGEFEHLFPIFEKVTLQTLRSKKLIQYTRVGKIIVYKKEWIEDYLNKNIKKVAD